MSDREKINIYLPKPIHDRLKNDALQFEFYKKDGISINMNKFLNSLLIGYYEDYAQECKGILDSISNELSSYLKSKKDIEEVAKKIVENTFARIPEKTKGTPTMHLSIKPIVESESLIQQIEKVDYFSPYFRRMIAQYCKKSICEREKIIFKSTYETLVSACEKRQEISFRTIWNKETVHTVIPYAVSSGQDELHNYLLCAEYSSKEDRQIASVYRLNRIDSVRLNYSGGSIQEGVIENLKRTLSFGAQHPINENELIIVRLNTAGLRNYNRYYIDRPRYDGKVKKVDDDLFEMHFTCSIGQVYNFFRRFDKNTAKILEPTSLREWIIDFHKEVLKAYESE